MRVASSVVSRSVLLLVLLLVGFGSFRIHCKVAWVLKVQHVMAFTRPLVFVEQTSSAVRFVLNLPLSLWLSPGSLLLTMLLLRPEKRL